jgi:Na+/melibiose symporter-like transporter
MPKKLWGITQLIPRIDLSDKDTRNAYYLVVEIFWASLLAAAASFNSAYAIRLGAANVEVGLLSSLPALFALLVSIPAGVFLQARSRRKPWIIASLAVNRLSYLLIILIPFLQFAGLSHGSMTVWVLVIASIPAHFFNVGFIPMLAEVTSEERRAAVFSARNIVYNASYSICTFLFGMWLNQVQFPGNYQIMFLVGFAASCFSTLALLKIEVPDATSVSKPAGLVDTFHKQVDTFREALTEHPEFIRITRNTLLHGLGLWLAGPLYVLYFVKTMKADDGWLGLQGTVLSAATILGFILWRRLLKLWGEQVTLKRTIVCAGIYPILAGLLPSLNLILGAVALNGLIAPGINLSHFNILLKVTPEANRPGYTALYITIVNLGAFVCPLIGVAIAGLIGTGPTLVLCGALSIIGSTSFWVWPVQAEKTP